MEPERLRQIEQLFHAALEVEKNRQTDFLREACGADESLRREVESLLVYRSKAENFIEQPAMELAAQGIAEDEVQAHIREAVATERGSGTGPMYWPPTHIGSYRVLRVLGEGGMGVIYEAEQEQPRRTVALKVIKPGMTSPELLRRFEQESRALARLQHPTIAQIYEAGTADTGFGPQPYFAMELIHGRSLREYAEEHRLNTGQRLVLMIRICEAVQHAHQRGLIHRDLKPGNILVDETGQPKILDFGVARVTDSDVESTRQTDLGQLVGTLAYMSPEQALGDPLEVDTRSDVYALGVILYELLAGRLPYDLSRKTHEAARTIQEEDPTPLSSISRVYRGDIETIVAKALEKDKARRYPSASGLAADIQRYLKDEPIAARPPSASYQLRKFARRNKALVAGVAAVFVVLIGGVIASTWEATRARRAEQAATTEAAKAKAVNDFLQNDLLAQASANTQARQDTKPDPDMKVRTALDRASARITGKFNRQPEVEAAVRDTMGQTYMDLGLYPEARTQWERALELHRRVLGPKNPETLKTISRLGRTALLQGKYPEAEALLSQTLEMQRRVGAMHPDTLGSMNNLANVYLEQGKYAQAEALFSQTLEIERRMLGAEHPNTLGFMNNLALVYVRQGKYAQAEALQGQALEIRRRVLGAEHPDTLGSMNNLARVYYYEGKHAQAEALHSQTLGMKRRVLGPEHPSTLLSMNNLANVYLDQGKYAQAEALYSQTLEIRRRVLGAEHPDTLYSMNNLALVYSYEGKYAQAQALDSQALGIKRRVLGPEHPETLISMNILALVYSYEGKYAQAEALYSQTLEIERRVLGPEHPKTLGTLSDFASMYQRRGKYGLAETHAAQALTGRRHVLGSEHPETMTAAVDLALAYLSQGRFAESEPLAREALEFDRKKQADDWQRLRAESLLGASLAGQKKYAEAESLLLSGYQGMAVRKGRIAVPDWYHLDRAREWIVQLYQAWGKPGKAAEWRGEL
jgi:tetratricopeptide (TPR) repeat protein/predicted Ser/Thr protein kinase